MRNPIENIWMWGYVIDRIPGGMPYALAGKSYCSLETAADYIGTNNIIYMNTRFNEKTLKKCHSGGAEAASDMGELSDKYFRHVNRFENILCSLENGNWVESASRISEFSLSHPGIKGCVFDDFRVPLLEETMVSPETVKQINDALKSKNPKLELYLVTFSYQNQDELAPYLDYFDGLMHWNWVPSMDYWQREYFFELMKLKRLTQKPVIQGMYIHDFGLDSSEPVPFDIFKYTVKKVYNFVRDETLKGCIIPQNGWFCDEKHRGHIQWLKEYTDWFCGTTTPR